MERLEERITSKTISIIVFTIISVAFTSPIYRNINYLGMQDMDEATFYVAVPRETILTHHQIPLWNPYQCGGQVLLASPQSVFLSPTFLINLIFGDILGIKIKIFVYLLIGLHGMFLMAQQVGIKGVSAYLPPFIFMLNSVYPLNITPGMLIFPIAYMPWALLFYLKKPERRYTVYSAMVLALMFLEGGTQLFVYTILFMGLYAVLTDVMQKKIDHIKKTVVITLLALLFCSVKLVPSLEFSVEYPHILKDYSGFSMDSFTHSLFDRDQKLFSQQYLSDKTGFLLGISYHWDENGMYIGFIPFILYMMGFITLKKDHKPLLVASLVFLWLSFGHRAPLSLYRVLHSLPVLESLRVATRFRIPFLFTLSLIAGLTASKIETGRIDDTKIKKIFILLAVITIILVGCTSFFWHFKDFIFHIGERVYYLEEHAHEFSFFRDAVEHIYLKIILNLKILAELSLTATLLAYMRVSGKITSTQLRYILEYGIIIFVLCDLMVVNSPIFSDAFIFPPFKLEKGTSFFQTENITTENNYSSEYFKLGEFFHKMKGNETFRATLERMSYSSMYVNFLQNRGSIACINPMGVRIFAVPRESKEYRGEIYLENGSGAAVISYFSPNKVEVEFNTSRDDYLVLNQNYFNGWRVRGNRFGRVEPNEGLVSTLVRPGEHNVSFYYLPESFILGALISIVSLMLAIFVVFYHKK